MAVTAARNSRELPARSPGERLRRQLLCAALPPLGHAIGTLLQDLQGCAVFLRFELTYRDRPEPCEAMLFVKHGNVLQHRFSSLVRVHLFSFCVKDTRTERQFVGKRI